MLLGRDLNQSLLVDNGGEFVAVLPATAAGVGARVMSSAASRMALR